MTEKLKRNLLVASRILVALLFVFSGLAKAIDPWGVSFVVEEYLRAYSLTALMGWGISLSIVLSAFEIILGAMLLFNILPRLISTLALVVMLAFSVVTLLSATVFTIADCGCFGEVLKLSPWATFAKNIVILPFVSFVWWYNRRESWFTISIKQSILVGLVAILAFGIGIFSYLFLPLIDLTPYREGVNLYELVYGKSTAEQAEDTYIYKSLSDDTLREFTLAELEALDETEWEWVETCEGSVVEPQSVLKDDFFIVDSEGDATRHILSQQGTVYLICVTDFEDIPTSCAERLKRVVVKAQENNDLVVILTPEQLKGITYYSFADSPLVRCYNMDARVMKNLLRAYNGLVVLHNSTITAKYNCRSVEF